jgi:dipeptidyl aminopeptidase/acylaminoacyl peptidase
MRPEDIARITEVVDHQLSEDGDLLVYVTRRVVDDSYENALWVSATEGIGPPRQLHVGAGCCAPSLSPDGREVAFFRRADERADDSAGRYQLCVLAVDAPKPRVVVGSAHPLGLAVNGRDVRGITPPAWSPDGSQLVYAALVAVPRRVHRITRRGYRMDGRGYLDEGSVQLFVVAPDRAAAPTRISDGILDHWDACWRPDGQALVCVRVQGREPGATAAPPQDIVEYRIDGAEVDGAAARVVAAGLPHATVPTYTADCGAVRFLGVDPASAHGTRIRGRNVCLMEVPSDGSARPSPLTDEEVLDVDDPRLRPLAPVGSPLVADTHEGTVRLIDPVAGRLDAVSPSGGATQALSHDARGDTVSAVLSTIGSAGDLRVRVRGGRARAVTSYAAGYRDAVVIPEEIRFASGEGEIHGWLYLPPDARGPVPLVLLIHGGPDAQFGYRLDVDAQVVCGRGCAVLTANPRGSAGYGQDFAMSICGRLGTVDADDVLAAVDAVVARPEIDAVRVGVAGRSYGGFLTAWLTTARPGLFKAAVAECGIYSWDSMIATSDIGDHLTELVGGDPAAWAHQSPLLRAGEVTAPTMIIAYGDDRRVPLEQAERYFHALHAAGTTCELVVFDGGPHSFAVTGSPAARITRMNLIGDWFDRYFSGG